MKVEPLSVIVVDPDDDRRLLTSQFMEIHGYVVQSAGCVRDAAQLLRREGALVGITELKLPDATGPTAVLSLHSAMPHGSVLAIADEATPADAALIMRSGAKDYIGRPFAYTELLERVKALMETAMRDYEESSKREWVISGYRVIQPLGKGAMGNLLEVERDGVRYALKTLGKPGESEASRKHQRQRFRRSGVIGATVDHPGLAKIHDFGVDDATQMPFVAMEMVSGPDLATYRRHNPKLSLEARVRIVRDVADAVGVLHGRDIVVRSISPASVTIREDGAPVITDFLYARLPASDLTSTGEIAGIPEYLAPECFTSQTIDPRADVFSLGCLAYELFLDRKPFFDATLMGVMKQIIKERPVRPRKVRADFPPPLETVLGKMMRKDPKERYRSMKEVVEELDRYLVGQAVEADSGFATKLFTRDWA